MKKIIFSDIDRTLSIEGVTSNNNKESIKHYIKASGLFILISGRGIYYTKKIVKDIGASPYMICNNGAIGYDITKDKIIYKKCISFDSFKKIKDICDIKGARLVINTQNAIFVTKIKYDSDILLTEDITSFYENNLITQLVVSTKGRSVTEEIINEIEKIKDVKIVNRKRSLYDDLYPDDNNYWLDITDSEANKGYGVKRILKYLNIDIKDSVRVGDDLNDLPMFFEEGVNVAVDNAISDLKEKSDYITLSCKEDGISYLIDKIIKEEL